LATPVLQYALARVGRLLDAFLINMDKLLHIAELVPDSARQKHNGLKVK
jgi:hypothetical protein